MLVSTGEQVVDGASRSPFRSRGPRHQLHRLTVASSPATAFRRPHRRSSSSHRAVPGQSRDCRRLPGSQRTARDHDAGSRGQRHDRRRPCGCAWSRAPRICDVDECLGEDPRVVPNAVHLEAIDLACRRCPGRARRVAQYPGGRVGAAGERDDSRSQDERRGGGRARNYLRADCAVRKVEPSSGLGRCARSRRGKGISGIRQARVVDVPLLDVSDRVDAATCAVSAPQRFPVQARRRGARCGRSGTR